MLAYIWWGAGAEAAGLENPSLSGMGQDFSCSVFLPWLENLGFRSQLSLLDLVSG